MTNKKKAELLVLFKTECHDRSEQIDPGGDEDWKSLTLGWAVAKGLPPAEAIEFASFVRYSTGLG